MIQEIKPKIKLSPKIQPELRSGEQVHASPLNSSISKQQYSFPKAVRFQRNKTQNFSYHYYDMPSTLQNRTITMGKSKRNTFDSNKAIICPPPNRYNYNSEGEFGYFNKDHKNNKGAVFALGRNNLTANNWLNIQKDNPGPSNYLPNPEVSLKRITNKFAFSLEKKFKSERKIDNDNIGPGMYNVKSPIQNPVLSSDKRPLCPIIHYSKNQSRNRIKTTLNDTMYYPQISYKGERLALKNHSKGFTIGRTKRLKQHINTNPDPGSYKIFSEFISKGKS